MATDVEAIIANLVAFYDFSGKRVIHVGAGGGQLIGYAHRARHVTAVDPDAQAIERLRERLTGELATKFTIVQGDFCAMRLTANVVLFEVCLHEIADPVKALECAARTAPDIVVIDHLPESEWSWYACETEKLEVSWGAVETRGVRRRAPFEAQQRFRDYEELLGKLGGLGEEATRRMGTFEGRRDIVIPMPYGIALL